MIVKKENDFAVVDADTGKALGTHDSFQKAVKQEYAIAKSQGKSKEEIQELINESVRRNYKKAEKYVDLLKLVKTAMIKLRPFKELKTTWYKNLLASKLAPNNPDIQSALRGAMPGSSGRLHNIVRELSNRRP